MNTIQREEDKPISGFNYSSIEIPGMRRELMNGGAVFSRWEEPRGADRKAEIEQIPMYFRGEDTACYQIYVPKPKAKICTGSILIVRESKNRYRIAAQNGNSVVFKTLQSVSAIRAFCGSFFGRR